eukprot:gene29548-38666_t
MHKGSKNFWRQRRIVDIYIVKHISFHILEVICFLPHTSVELPRVYISFPALVAILDEQEIEEKCHARKEFFLRQKKRIDSNTILEKVTEDMVVAYIVSKIDLQAICEDRYQILFESTNNEGDAHTKASFIFPKPHNLEPFVVHYNTLASTEDFQSTLQKFREDSKAAKSHNEIAFHALHPGAEGVEQVLALKLQHDREIKLKYSRAKCRWIKAINRVMIQNYVAKVRQRLAHIDAKNNLKSINKKLFELQHLDSLPLISIGSDAQHSLRSQGRIKRFASRKDSSKSLYVYDSDAAPTYFPTQLSSQSFHGVETSTAPSAEAATTNVVDQDFSPPSILHSYREKSSSSKNLSIPWLNDSGEEWPIMSTKRTVLRPIAKRRTGRIIVV